MDLAITTRWTARVSFPSILRGNVTNFVPHKALQLIELCKLTLDERVVAYRVDSEHIRVAIFVARKRLVCFRR